MDRYEELMKNTTNDPGSGLTLISKKFIKRLDEKLGEGAFGVVYKTLNSTYSQIFCPQMSHSQMAVL
uniref:Protein kinase domain-containing protein n=1 Tax=Acrobeloides nanus TaxID=290746 RepID=A0A914EIG5_9BILA